MSRILISAAMAALLLVSTSAYAAVDQPGPPPPAEEPKQKNPPVKKPITPEQQKRASQVEKVVAVPPADDYQLLAAKQVYYGESKCELGNKIGIERNKANPGYVDLEFKKKTYVMKPVISPTGSLRLEDVEGDKLVVQIESKSMVLDQKTGKRLVDDCKHDHQKEKKDHPATPALIK